MTGFTDGRGGAFVISLDFELYWGLRDHVELSDYAANLRGVWDVVPALLSTFRSRAVHATWATVGFLLFEGFDELHATMPAVLPEYRAHALCPYRYAKAHDGSSERVHFAPALVKQILETEGQELGTHTLSHFYCLEEPQSLAAFSADLEIAIRTARERFDTKITSLVFPRNQCSTAHVARAAELGITAFRGNPHPWMYGARPFAEETAVRRGARLADAYVSISRGLAYDADRIGMAAPFDVAASRFLRPWSRATRWAERLRIRRIQKEMRDAARSGRIYHLWWHPHNFGVNLQENLAVLSAVLDTYRELHDAHGMQSMNMRDVAAWRSSASGTTWSAKTGS